MEIAERAHGDEEAGATPSSRPAIRVLLVEDNPGDARLIEIMLEEADAGLFRLERADRLETALSRLKRGGIDVVLADLSLPDSHGLETFARLHASAPHVPIIVLSGLSDTTVAVNAVHEGAQDFLVKGQVDGQLLARAIQYAIERKRMSEQLHRYAEELREKNAQLESDFNMAREIQQTFLPSDYPVFPRWITQDRSALRFSHRYIPAAAVGGDFFDVFAVDDTRAGMLICDVMGHGMRAALITAVMRGLIEELMPLAADAGGFMTEVNRSLRAILRQTRETFLATAWYAVLDVAAHELCFANAGHPSPLRVRRSTGTVETLKSFDPRHGPALGLFEKTVYPTGQCAVDLHDLIFLFTDGIYEASNAQGDEFGQQRLLETVRRSIHLPAERLLDALLEKVRRFSGNADLGDDICLVAAEVLPLTPGA